MKVDGSLKSLLQGVSQQPPRDRLAGQCTEQLNLSADPVNGLRRRSPTDLVSKLLDFDGEVFWNEIQTTDGGKYILGVANSKVYMWDYNGNAKFVATDDSIKSYLSSVGNLRCAVVENKVYITNTSVAPRINYGSVAAYANEGPGSRRTAIVQVLGGAYGKGYKVFHDGNQIASYDTPNGAQPSDIQFVRTTYIAAQLATGINAALGLQGYTVAVNGPNIAIVAPDTRGYTITVTDDAGGLNMKATSGVVSRQEDLPPTAVPNMVIRVATKSDPDEDAWFRFVNAGDSGGVLIGQQGYWQECVSPGTPYGLDPGTMPVVVNYAPDSQTFHAQQEDWKSRQVGTAISNPDPSFVGAPINDICTFQSRLVFLSGANVIMSRTNRHSDFWKGSVVADADTDVIDVSSTAAKAAVMRAAVAHNRDLVIFTDRGQFVVYGRQALTPKNATLVLTTSFEASLQARPTPAGRNVFFSTVFGRYSGIREFYTEGATEINDSRPITQHVKEFIAGRVLRLAASSNYDTLLVLSETDRRVLYVYQYIWSDNEKVQSAWSSWRLPIDIQFMFFDSELIYIVGKRDGQVVLLRMSLDQHDSEGVGFPVYMDCRFDVFDVGTAFAPPYSWMADEELIVIQGSGCPNPGMRARVRNKMFVPNTGWVYTLNDDMQGGNLIVGAPFMSRYVPTPPNVKDSDGVPIGTGTLTIRHYIVSLHQTAEITARLTSQWGDGEPVRFNGRIVGDIKNVLGDTPLSDDKFYIPFREKSTDADIEIYSDGPFPMSMLEIEWEGQYVKKGRRISMGGK